MVSSVAQHIHDASQALLLAVRVPGANITEKVNSTLNEFLTWPFQAGCAVVVDTAGHNATFDSVIYASSDGKTKDVKTNADGFLPGTIVT